MKRTALIAAAALSAVLALTGCGRADNNTNTNGGMSSTTSNSSQTTTNSSANTTQSSNNTNGNENNETTRTTGDIDGDGFIEEIVTEAGDIVNDVVTGAEDIVDNAL